MEADLKVVPVDTNHYYLAPDCPSVPPMQAAALGLVDGEEVVASMPPESWRGVVRLDDTLPEEWVWWVELGEEIL